MKQILISIAIVLLIITVPAHGIVMTNDTNLTFGEQKIVRLISDERYLTQSTIKLSFNTDHIEISDIEHGDFKYMSSQMFSNGTIIINVYDMPEYDTNRTIAYLNITPISICTTDMVLNDTSRTNGVWNPVSGDYGRILINVTDDGNVSSVTADLASFGHGNAEELHNCGGDTYSITFITPSDIDPGDIDVALTATDNEGAISSTSISVGVLRGGDLNYDSVINIYDAIILMGYVTNPDEMVMQDMYLADMNGDGNIDMLDVLCLLCFIVGM